MQPQKDAGLGDRDKEVLASVIRLHIQTGEPIGSATLAQRSKEGVSSATIRNILSDLESAGYLTHPHTSAGRMPTDKVYRFYVDQMLESKARPSKSDEAVIRRYLSGDEPLTTQELMERTSHLLSEVSENVGFVLTPFFVHDALKHVKFVKLTDRRIMVIIVLRSGLIQDRVIRVTEDFSQDELDITVHENTLIVTGKSEKEDEDGRYLHRGIARRAFERRFSLADHLKVTGASMDNGLLHVDLVREVPEAMKPRQIKIAGSEPTRKQVIEQKAA